MTLPLRTGRPPGAGRAWPVYFVLLVLYLGASEVQAWRHLADPGPTDVVLRLASLVFAGVALTGLYGFIRRRPILRPAFWWLVLALLIVAIVSSVWVLLSLAPTPVGGPAIGTALALYFLPLLPLLYALGRYAADPSLWH
ncbi:MAG: hypothetical protein ABEJ96_09120 [Thiohalorhabdaceae bacterium]